MSRINKSENCYIENDVDFVDVSLVPLIDKIEVRQYNVQVVTLQVKFRGYPEPELRWYGNSGELKSMDAKYKIKINDNYSILKIYDLSFQDTGNYTLKADNSQSSAEIQIELRVLCSFVY